MTIMEILVLSVFSWPGVIIGGLLLGLGIAQEKVWLGAVGAILANGFCVYIGMNPAPVRYFGLLALAGNYLCIVAIWRRAGVFAMASLVPLLLLTGYLAYAVLTE
jgi:hypothetical protein